MSQKLKEWAMQQPEFEHSERDENHRVEPGNYKEKSDDNDKRSA